MSDDRGRRGHELSPVQCPVIRMCDCGAGARHWDEERPGGTHDCCYVPHLGSFSSAAALCDRDADGVAARLWNGCKSAKVGCSPRS
jgi:hypothetical protein